MRQTGAGHPIELGGDLKVRAELWDSCPMLQDLEV